MRKEVASFVVGKGAPPDWAQNKISFIHGPPLRSETFVDATGKERRRWLPLDKAWPITEGTYWVDIGMKVVLMDDDSVEVYAKED